MSKAKIIKKYLKSINQPDVFITKHLYDYEDLITLMEKYGEYYAKLCLKAATKKLEYEHDMDIFFVNEREEISKFKLPQHEK